MKHPTSGAGLLKAAALLLFILGIVLIGGGGWLLILGDTPFYLAAGLAMAATAVLLWRRRPAALWVYTALVLATLAWALWEAGLDWWPLAARGDVVFVLGLVLLTPWIARALWPAEPRAAADAAGQRPAPARWMGARLALALSLLLFLAVSVASWFVDPTRIEGSFAQVDGPPPTEDAAVPPGEWHAYGRTGHGQRYSPLTQITPQNVSQLQVAWTYRTGDVRGQPGDPEETTFQVTPLKIGNTLFLCTPHQSVVALDAATGKEIWRRDLKVRDNLALQHLTCRGLSYQPAARTTAAHSAPAEAAENTQPPAEPPLPADQDPAQRGEAGTEDTDGPAQETPQTLGATEPTRVPAERPPAHGELPELPLAAAEGPTRERCPARLFMPTADGRLVALSPEDGAVCLDFADRGQLNLWGNMPHLNLGSYYSTSPVVVTESVIVVGGTVLDNVSTTEPSGVIRAYDTQTGRLVWNWDSGNPERTEPLAPGETYTANSPNSWSISSVDEELGMVYVPMGNQPPDQWGGERSENAERYSSSVVALDLKTGQVRWHFQTVRHDLWDYDVPSQPSLLTLNIDGRQVPALVQPTKQGEIYVLDRRTGEPLLPVTDKPAPQGAAEGDYTAETQPVSALSFDPPPLTGADMWGATMFDQMACRIALKRLRYEGRYTPPSTQGTLVYPGNFGVFNWGSIAVDPQRQMAFTTPTYLAFVSRLIPREDDETLYVQDGPPHGVLPNLNENIGAPFAVHLGPFTSLLGLPCQAPPWGYVAGADLTTGEIVWKHRNGTVRDASPLPLPFRMGVPNLGGPVMTASGVAFLSGTIDNYVRAYDVRDGKQLWEHRLPAGGQATPMTYTAADGRQFLLVVAGGHGSLGTKAGDYVIAYALPD
ncbi:PQQ-binding-like beta-propeller repeat protein [Orrella sp. JC864]|uniref:outer membrane protein assembly factor BamB family protein n=1 Tax=Orrella sp. JC864 TaxID=3120298 RepID=UPI003008339A